MPDEVPCPERRKLVIVGTKVPAHLKMLIDKAVTDLDLNSPSEFIRLAIREALGKYLEGSGMCDNRKITDELTSVRVISCPIAQEVLRTVNQWLTDNRPTMESARNGKG